MDPEQLQGYIMLGSALVNLGFDTAVKIKDAIRRLSPERTDAELNQIIDGVAERARARRELALAEARKAESLIFPQPGDPDTADLDPLRQ